MREGVILVLVLFVVDFLVSWGVLHMALELAQAVLPFFDWEPTALVTLGGAVLLKLLKVLV